MPEAYVGRPFCNALNWAGLHAHARTQVLHHHVYRPSEFAAYRQQTVYVEDALASAEAALRAASSRTGGRPPDPVLDATVRQYSDALAQ